MVATTADEIAELEEACFEVARTTKWTQRPIDADDICRHAQRLFEIALREICEPLGRHAALITRAVHYLGTAHAIPPMDEDTEWFARMLSAVVEVARPNSFHEGKGQEFLEDMLEGIQSRLES